MTEAQASDTARLPVALCVATGHEANIVQRALKNANNAIGHPEFVVVQVGVGCCDIDAAHVAETYSGIVSIGFAGAIAPNIESGTLLLPNFIKKIDQASFKVDSKWQHAITKNSGAVVAEGDLLHVDLLLATTSQKQHAHTQSRCIACDMESASLASIAEQRGRSFACLRIVLDPANTRIPEPIVRLTDAPGEPSVSAFLKAILQHPSELPATVTFLWHTFKASRVLSKTVTRLGEGRSE